MSEEKLTPEEEADDSRREFLSKSATAAGAAALGAILAGAIGSADAQVRRPVREGVQPETMTRAPAGAQMLRNAALQYRGLPKGHAFEMSGPQLAEVLGREGLLPKDQLGKDAVMSLSLTWA